MDDVLSWMPREDSERKVFDWWNSYWEANLNLVAAMNVEGEKEEEINLGQGRSETKTRTPSRLLILKRKAAN